MGIPDFLALARTMVSTQLNVECQERYSLSKRWSRQPINSARGQQHAVLYDTYIRDDKETGATLTELTAVFVSNLANVMYYLPIINQHLHAICSECENKAT